MFLHPVQRFLMAFDPGLAHLVIGARRAGHEFDIHFGNRVSGVIDIARANRDVLNALALVFPEVGNDLAFFVPVLVDRDANAPARRGQGPRRQPRMLAGNVEKPDLAEIEQVTVEPEPNIHVPLEHIVGQVIEIVKPHPFRLGLCDPVVFPVIGGGVVILIYKVNQ